VVEQEINALSEIESGLTKSIIDPNRNFSGQLGIIGFDLWSIEKSPFFTHLSGITRLP
jgi:hypothetical protein